MDRRIFAFLWLISCNFVSALPTGTANGSVAEWLAELSGRCESPVIKLQINNQIKDCDVSATPFHEKQFECMLFYDINNRLCDAIATKKITINEESISKINGKLNINELCNIAHNLIVSNLAQYPSYKGNVQKIFANTIKCVQFCGVDDIAVDDANYYCKYFKWGSNTLASNILTDSDADILVRSNNTEPISSETKTEDLQSQTVVSGQSSLGSQQIASKTHAVLPESQSSTINVLTQSRDISAVPKNVAPDDVAIPLQGAAFTQKTLLKDISQSSGRIDIPSLPQSTNVTIDNSKKEGVEPSVTGDKPIPKDEQQQYGDQSNNPIENGQKPDKPNPDPEYVDTDEIKEGFSDTQGVGDDVDPVDPVIGQNVNVKQSTYFSKKTENSVASFDGNLDVFPNSMQDTFTEDEDHFFPFFLTAIVIIVVLYVLYHNKNKVTKVLLGLIVEGRQSNRRRTSRGHAYRRLDTLEQAMSTNTSAPPSKIIY